MRFRLSVAARSRAFSRAMRRVRPTVQLAIDNLAQVELKHPTWNEVLVGITDEHGDTYNETVQNNDDSLQVLVGFPNDIDLSPANDRAILTAMLGQLQSVVRKCGLTPEDEAHVIGILNGSPAS